VKFKALNPANVHRLLFVTLSNIGDVVMAMPTLAALHQQFPKAVIDIVGDARSEILFKHCSYVGRFYRKEKGAGYAGLWHLIQALRKTQYDLAVDLRSDGLLHLIKATVKLHKHANHTTLHLHSVEKHFAAMKPILNGVNNDIPSPKITLSTSELTLANTFFAEMQAQRVLALGLGANFAGKIWPWQAFVALANALSPAFDAVLLLGSQQELALTNQFQAAFHGRCFNACGQFNLLETTALLAKADYFVGNDSGLGHLASAAGVPTCTLFGVGAPHRYRPWGDLAIWLQEANQNIHAIRSDSVAVLVNQHLALLAAKKATPAINVE
jgi:heptosyltransferase-3